MRTTCPPNHTEYLSQTLADNAVTLHRMKNPGCDAIEAFPCGDHFHIGHNTPAAREQCHRDSVPITRD